jgi:hypothetical protein
MAGIFMQTCMFIVSLVLRSSIAGYVWQKAINYRITRRFTVSNRNFNIVTVLHRNGGPGSSVGIAIDCGLDGPGIELAASVV